MISLAKSFLMLSLMATAGAAIPQVQPAQTGPKPSKAEGLRGRTVMMTVTAYCPCKICCGPRAKGITASGERVSANGGKFVAADTRLLPMRMLVSIPGYHSGQPVPVLDCGGKTKGRRLDVFFPSHQRAKQWGVRHLSVTIL